MKRVLTSVEKLMANRLSTQVTFLPGSYDKRFCIGLPSDGEYSEKQIAFLHKCFHKYRRQIKDYERIALAIEADTCYRAQRLQAYERKARAVGNAQIKKEEVVCPI